MPRAVHMTDVAIMSHFIFLSASIFGYFLSCLLAKVYNRFSRLSIFYRRAAAISAACFPKIRYFFDEIKNNLI